MHIKYTAGKSINSMINLDTFVNAYLWFISPFYQSRDVSVVFDGEDSSWKTEKGNIYN